MKNYPANYPRPNPKRFDGRRLKQRRDQLGLTQVGLGFAIGYTHVAVWRWETGRSQPSAQAALNLAEAFGIPIEDLYLYSEAQKATA